MSEANAARAKARIGLDLLAQPVGPYCPLNGHGFTCPCRECSDYWAGSAGVMVWQAWKDHAEAVGDL